MYSLDLYFSMNLLPSFPIFCPTVFVAWGDPKNFSAHSSMQVAAGIWKGSILSNIHFKELFDVYFSISEMALLITLKVNATFSVAVS